MTAFKKTKQFRVTFMRFCQVYAAGYAGWRQILVYSCSERYDSPSSWRNSFHVLNPCNAGCPIQFRIMTADQFRYQSIVLTKRKPLYFPPLHARTRFLEWFLVNLHSVYSSIETPPHSSASGWIARNTCYPRSLVWQVIQSAGANKNWEFRFARKHCSGQVHELS